MHMLLNGEWVDRPEKIEVCNPQDGRVIDKVPQARAEDMSLAISSAVMVHETMDALPTHLRISVLQKAADAVASRCEQFARIIALEGIKTIREARKEAIRCAETLRLSAEEARRISGQTIPFDQRVGSEHRLGYYFREPVGVIGAITPFNDPLNLVAHKVGPALAAGNAIIVKPHSATPLSALMLAQTIQDAGLPRGFLQVITGGRATGESILKKSGLKKVAMELGSNTPVIVMPDADLDLALSANVSGAFWAAGQNCLHVQRLLLHEEIYSEFSARFIAAAAGYHVGDKLDEATDMGPLISEAAAIRVESLVNEAIAAGGTLLTGGKRSGTFYAPTVLENLPPNCTLSSQEVYGPVTVLCRFTTLEEAIRLANSTDYGLQAGIFTRDIQTAFRAIAGLRCGGVIVNDSTDYRIDSMPFGGVKGSGLGREGVQFAVQEMTEPKVVCITL